MGYAQAQIDRLQHLAKGEQLDCKGSWMLAEVLDQWLAVNNGCGQLDSLPDLLLSDIFWLAPTLDISTRLIARLTLDQEPIKASDVYQIATVLPYAHITWSSTSV